MSKIPKECPFLDKCEQLVTKFGYKAICKSENWIFCLAVPEELVKKYRKKLREWKKEEVVE